MPLTFQVWFIGKALLEAVGFTDVVPLTSDSKLCLGKRRWENPGESHW